jgi:diguanylate cyclase (GGDEF)-like protein
MQMPVTLAAARPELLLRLPDDAASSGTFARLRADNASAPFIADVEQPAESVIMMVDDEEVNLDVIQALLEDAGYNRFVPTSRPLQALELLRKHRPDVLLLDLMMPELNGFEILKAMRADDALRHIPVIVLTSSTDAETKLQALELGATDFLAKPVDPSELALRLRNTLSAKAYRDRLANFDPVTELPNRRLFSERLDQALCGCASGGPGGVVMQVQLGRFKRIVDAFGLGTGDAVLKAVALRLDLGLRAGGLDGGMAASLYRLSGDEFTVLVTGVTDAQCTAPLAAALLNALGGSFRAGGRDVTIVPSIGISVFPDDGMEPGELASNAGAAMRHAEQQGGNCYRFFSRTLNARSVQRLTIENELRRALDRDELRLVYQPKVRVRTGRGSAAEALVRWMHPERGLVSPGEFIPVAEESGLIVPLGEWVLRAACAQIRAWRDAGLRVPRISVNVSGEQFRAQQLSRTVAAALAGSGVDPRHLALELTESAIMDDAPSNVRTLHELKDLGLMLSIDDFGTGYSSLSYLKRFPLDELKIDRSFVNGVDTDPDNHAIVAAIIAMAHGLGLTVVGEGVETEEQLAVLKLRGCDECQGFLFSKPIPPEAFTRLLAGTPRPQQSAGVA